MAAPACYLAMPGGHQRITTAPMLRSARPHRLPWALGLLLAPACRDFDELVPILAPEAFCASERVEFVDCTIDGDTVYVGGCSTGESVRLLGVQAPEIEHPPDPAQCWGDEAWAWLDERLAGAQVTLAFDQECTDIYGRTLAWIWLEGDEADPIWDELVALDGLGIDADAGTYEVLVNEWLVRAGQARLYDEGFARDVRYYERLEAAEAMAALEGRGLWGACDP